MPVMRFRLDLPAESYRRYYQGLASMVQVRTLDGQNLRFPANVLRPWLGHAGVSGLFEIEFDENRRFVSLQRLSA